jgi:hypothetical protein
MLTMRTERVEPRCVERDGKLYVGVTSAMKLVKWVLQEQQQEYFGINEFDANMHRLEGTSCHAVCLDWLAHKFSWLPDSTEPPWPGEKFHNDERRWHNVLSMAINGFTEFVQQYEVEPIVIEQESLSFAYGLVGHLDLFCSLKRKGRRVKAVVDLKFVSALMASHLLQVRCYGRLDGFKDANIGILYHANRNTGLWKIEEVDLTAGLDDVAAVANAARLWAWAEQKKGR